MNKDKFLKENCEKDENEKNTRLTRSRSWIKAKGGRDEGRAEKILEKCKNLHNQIVWATI